ncbi:MAG: VOC family protein [Actinomycetota bacterium]|nr:VOC family protein [Actinomycetota bacterium]
MGARFVHTCIRSADIDRSTEFYERLGFERRG